MPAKNSNVLNTTVLNKVLRTLIAFFERKHIDFALGRGKIFTKSAKQAKKPPVNRFR